MDKCSYLIDLIFGDKISLIKNHDISEFNLIDKKLTERDFSLLFLISLGDCFYYFFNAFKIFMEIEAVNYSYHCV